MGLQVKSATVLSDHSVGLLAFASATAYYIQSLLVEVGGALSLSSGLVGILPALSQIGLACGLAFLLPLGDIISARRLLLTVIPIQIVALGPVRHKRFGPYGRGGIPVDRIVRHHTLCQPACAGLAARPGYGDADAWHHRWNPARSDRIRHYRDTFRLACGLLDRCCHDDDRAGLPHSHC